MANKFKLKQSSVAGKVPATADLILGELAVNTTDGKLFLKKSVSGVESVVDVTAGTPVATAAAVGGVKGFTNLTIDAAGALSLLAANIAAALGYTAQPTGIMQQFAGSTAPTGWLLCNGAAISRATYAALFAIIGTTYGAGDGSTTFNLPDLQNRVAVGAGGGKSLGTTGGAASATPTGTVGNTTLTLAQLPSHRHQPRSYDGSGSGIGAATGSGGDTPDWMFLDSTTQAIWVSNTEYQGGGQAHNHSLSINGVSVEQPWTAVNYIIKI